MTRDGGLTCIPAVDVDHPRERAGEGGPVVVAAVESAFSLPVLTPDGDGSLGASDRVVAKDDAKVAAGLIIVS